MALACFLIVFLVALGAPFRLQQPFFPKKNHAFKKNAWRLLNSLIDFVVALGAPFPIATNCFFKGFYVYQKNNSINKNIFFLFLLFFKNHTKINEVLNKIIAMIIFLIRASCSRSAIPAATSLTIKFS